MRPIFQRHARDLLADRRPAHVRQGPQLAVCCCMSRGRRVRTVSLLNEACVAQRRGYRHTSRGPCRICGGHARNDRVLVLRYGVSFRDRMGRDGPTSGSGYAELHMRPIVNLRIARKQAKRRQAEQQAARNRLAFGRSRAERTVERSESDKARTDLDQHRIERKDGP